MEEAGVLIFLQNGGLDTHYGSYRIWLLLIDFGSIVDSLFHGISMFFASLFRALFWHVFSIFFSNFRFSHFRANPRRHVFLRGIQWFPCFHHFRKISFFMMAFFEKYQEYDQISNWFSLIVMTFSASISALICSSIFDGKWFPKWSREIPAQRPFWQPFRDLFRRSISVACGNSSAPGPREDNLHAKNCKKFDVQGQCWSF